jgi:predicted deacetylase
MPIVVAVVPNISAEVRNRYNTIFFPIENDVQSVSLLNRGLENGFQLALHGLTHQTHRDRSATEYANLPFESQLQSIRKGMNHLSRVFPNAPLEVFIPPWNSFDDSTVDAVGKTGLRIVCGGENIEAYSKNGVLVVPGWALKGFINYLRYYSLDDFACLLGGSSIVIMMHSYDFVKTASRYTLSLDEFGAVLGEIRTKNIEVGILPVDVQPTGFIPTQECLLRARLDLLRRQSMHIGTTFVGAAHIIKRTVGQAIADKALDRVAFGLQKLKAIRNHLR